MRFRPEAAALAVILMCGGLAPASAREKRPAPAAAVSPAEEAQLREAARRGALLYAYDQAAWHGTDDMVARLPDYRNRVGGWIVDGPAEAPELVFFDQAGERPVYVARFRDGKLVSGEVVGDGELGEPRRRLVAARTAALDALARSGSKGCSQASMNSVVLPPAGPGEPTLVYVLTPQRTMDAFPFGGHYLIPVDATGRAGPIRRFTKTCIELGLKPDASGSKPAALVISHLLDPVPTEIHVFSSLAARLPVIVATLDKRVWVVDGTRIRLVPAKRK
jgi:hypothetical protein